MAMAEKSKLKQLVMQYLDEAKLMQIATVNGDRPWVATVWYAADKDMNLYFVSRTFRRHSMEMMKNPNVAGTIVKPHTIGSGEKVRGLQFEGTGRICNEKEFRIAHELYSKRYIGARIPPISEGNANEMVKFYIIKPKLFVLFDEVNFPEEPRQELPL